MGHFFEKIKNGTRTYSCSQERFVSDCIPKTNIAAKIFLLNKSLILEALGVFHYPLYSWFSVEVVHQRKNSLQSEHSQNQILKLVFFLIVLTFP